MAMPWEKRVLLLLLVANRANETINVSHPESFDVCCQALRKCKEWVDGAPVSPENLAAYLDADEAKNPWLQESIFNEDPDGLNALVFVTMVVGHVANLAYVNSGESRRMSEAIAEAGSNIFESIAEFGERYGLSELI